MDKNLDILLVEDSQTQALKLKLMLENNGYKVSVAPNGQEGMHMLMNHPVSTVITDWMMPEMDGRELCQAIRQHDFDNYVYILLLTAKDAKGDIIEGLEAGADDYLIKPVDDAELIARLTTASRIISLESSLKQRNREIALLSITDPLTKVFNRGYLNENLPKALKRAERYQLPLSVLIADIDNFKKVNDQYGHQAGDRVLKTFVDGINATLRRDLDWIARYGGEEFIIVLPETDLAGAQAAAEKFRSIVAANETETKQGMVRITASFGIATVAETPDIARVSVDTLINTADRCLYQAKQAGRNRCIGKQL